MNMQAQLRAAFEAAQAKRDADEQPVVPSANIQVDETVTVKPVRPLIKVKPLDQKAMLVVCKRGILATSKLDPSATDLYAAGNVRKHLFKGAANRVKKANHASNEVYLYVKENTVPWMKGVDMLNMMHYQTFTAKLREFIAKADAAVDDLVNHWDDEVATDLLRLRQIEFSTGQTGLANPDDYPSASEVRDRYVVDVRFMPVPKTSDFDPRIISSKDIASLQRQLDDAETNATKHVIQQMLEPLTAAAEKLAVPIGKDGAVFRDSLIGNMIDAADRMNRVNISDDPEVQQRIMELQALVGKYAGKNMEVLRHSPNARSQAKSDIEALMGKMQGLV